MTSKLSIQQSLAGSGKGFHLTFENGWTASVQWGFGNYCNNRHRSRDDSECENAEVAAWNGDEWHDFGNDKVKGYLTADEVLEFLNLVAKK